MRSAEVALDRAGRAAALGAVRRHAAPALRRLEMEHDLYRALDRAELRSSTSRCRCADGVLGPRRSCVGAPDARADRPAEFVLLAEETGLIMPIGAWVLEEACRRARGWRTEHGRGVAVSVNLSGSAAHAAQSRRGGDARARGDRHGSGRALPRGDRDDDDARSRGDRAR